MRKTTFVLISLLPVILFGQIDVDTIFLWDNDRGLSSQQNPAVGARSWGSWIMWQDSRFGDFDIYRQGVYWDYSLNGINETVSNDPLNEYIQTNVDIEGNPSTMWVAVWEESLYIRGREQPTAIYARRFGTGFNPFLVYGNSGYSQKRPSVSCNDDGWFTVTFTRNVGPPSIPSIFYYVFDNNCNIRSNGYVRARDSILRRPPVSRVAYCDSGFVVVYDDTSSNGTCRSIYLAYFDPGFNLKVQHLKVSHRSGEDYANEEIPAVSTDSYGAGIIVWQDFRSSQSNSDLYGVTFRMRPGLGTITLGTEMAISQSIYNELRPRVTMLNNNDFFAVWHERQDTMTTDTDIWGRLYANGSLKAKIIVCNSTLDQGYADVEAQRNHDTCTVVWCGVEAEPAKIPGTYYDMYSRHYRNNRETMYPLGNAITCVPDTAGGRRGWYFDDENYDNPLTAWNEDPIDEPDSVYTDLEFAIMDQIHELNTNNQYMVVCAETLPVRPDTQFNGESGSDRALTAYEAIFLDLGYRTNDASAGTLTQKERNDMVAYINGRNPTMVEGNDFGYLYDTTAFFKKYKAMYSGDGASYLNGNVDTLYGNSGTSFDDETLAYDYQSWTDNYVDVIDPNGGELLLYNNVAKDRWIAGRCVGWGTYWKDGTKRADVVDSFTVYSSSMLSSIKSRTHPHTYAELFRRLLGYLGLACQPEPITSIICSTYAALEGAVIIKWQVVSDNKPLESAEGSYKLKLSPDKMGSEDEYNSAEEYYQTWNTADSAVGAWRRQLIYGLPPAETLVAALKVSDESALWDALGAEPRVVVSGDTLTPHTIRMGASYGYFKDFLNRQEFINRRRVNDSGSDYDSLFVTWDGLNFYTGYARCDFRSEGDLFIYVDTRPGMGGDSTIDYNGTGSATKSRFVSTFRPDYCLIIENNLTSGRIYKKWVEAKGGRAGSWQDIVSNSTYHVEDGVINNYLYTEIRIPFDTMAYTPGNEIKVMVVMQSEATNQMINAYPIFNPLGTGVYLTQYYTWGSGGMQSGMVPARRGVIGIEEEKEYAGTIPGAAVTGLAVSPNPFTSQTKILLPVIEERPSDVTLKIFDASGRLVKNLLLQTNFSTTQHGGLLPSVFNWEGKDDQGERLPGGVYFCELKTPEKTEVEKIIYVR